jgi:hypothetical protein
LPESLLLRVVSSWQRRSLNGMVSGFQGLHFDFMGKRWATFKTHCLPDVVGGKMRKMGLESVRLF